MTDRKTFRVPKLFKLAIALLLAGGVLVLSVSAIGNNEKEKIVDVKVNVVNIKDGGFVSEKEVLSILNKKVSNGLVNHQASTLNLAELEGELKQQGWIRQADLYIDNRNVLHVNIEQYKPVARVFTTKGGSFYLSEEKNILPLKQNVAVRVPVFTGFAGNPAAPVSADSLLLEEIMTLGNFVRNDDFWMSQIDQIDITSSGKFEIIPMLGNQVIRLGTAEGYSEKFRKLMSFYKGVMVPGGWNKYAVIDVQYKGQIVAERRNAAEIKADSLASVRIMKSVVEAAKKNTNDDTFIQLPENRPERENRVLESSERSIEVMPEVESVQEPEVAPVNAPETGGSGSAAPKATTESPKNKEVKKEVKAAVKVPVTQKEVKSTPKKQETKQEVNKSEKKVPKAVMPSKSN